MHYKCFTKNIAIIILLGLELLNNGCKKLVDTDGPITSISGKNVYTNDATAIAVLSGLYTVMSQTPTTAGDLTGTGFLTGLTSDELSLYGGNTADTRLLAFYQNRLDASIGAIDLWNQPFNTLYTINSAIEGLSKPGSITENVRVQLLGEAKFMRALNFFYLVNLYGDVPLVISSDYTLNLDLHRSTTSTVWKQIIMDLEDAQNLLSSDYLNGTLLKSTNERVRPTKWAATALLARAYLYTKDWTNAELEASIVISQTSLYRLTSLDSVFIKNNNEAIWQLQPVLTGWNSEDAKAYIFNSDFGPNGASGVSLSNELLKSFEPNDQRKSQWIDTVSYEGTLYSYAYKYKLYTYGDPVNEYNTVLRLGEQYLIRAEARVQQNNIDGAREDIKIIRQRAGLENTNSRSKTELLSIILHERQVELFTEWGHRWLDLKRTNNVNAIMEKVTPLKGGSWSTNWQLFPIPLYDLQTNTNITQNTGY